MDEQDLGPIAPIDINNANIMDHDELKNEYKNTQKIAKNVLERR